MNRWRAFLALATLLLVHGYLGEARRMVIFDHAGDTSREWMTLKVMDFHKELGRGFTLFSEKEVIPFVDRESSKHRFRDISSFVCEACLDISTFAEQVLTEPETSESVLDYINGSLCEALPSFQEECASLAKLYVPGLVETLQVYAAPDKLCGQTKLCPSSAMIFMNDARACKMCTNLTAEALSYIQDSKTEEEVMDVLHAQCAKLGDFSSRCDMYVDTYGPLFINKVEAVTPEQVCEKVGMCRSSSTNSLSHCDTCKIAMLQLKAKLKNPVVQDKLLEMLLDSCSKVPAHVDQCKEIVTQYAPYILANIDNYVDAEMICTEIHACDSRKKFFGDDMVIRLPAAHDSIAHE